MFQKGTKDRFLTEAGVPYGWICLEGYEPHYILTLENGQKFLKGAVEKEILTADEAAGIDSEMQSHGVLPGIAEVVAKINSVKLPPELIGDWGFELCTRCDPALVHGYIRHDGEAVGNAYVWLRALLEDLDQNVREGVLTANEAILVFQKAASLNLPNTEDEAVAKVNALPDEVRARLFGQLRPLSLLGALFGGDMSSVVLGVVMVGNPRGDGERKPGDEGKGADKAPGDQPSNGPDAAPAAP